MINDNIFLKNNTETIDDLHRNNYKIIQDKYKFRFGIDAVLLSSFAKIKNNDTVLDMCTGNGIIPILLSAKTNGKLFIGLEIIEECVDMANRSVLLNNLQQKVQIHHGDLKEADNIYPLGSFDVITCNPPYFNNQTDITREIKLKKDHYGMTNDNYYKAIARHEIFCTLEDIIKMTSKLLKVNGRFYMIHRPSRLVDIFSLLRSYNLEPKTMRLVSPKVEKEPNLVLIEAIKNSNPMLKVLSPLIIYDKDNNYTDEIHKIYYE